MLHAGKAGSNAFQASYELGMSCQRSDAQDVAELF
jgi:hypothetical protein